MKVPRCTRASERSLFNPQSWPRIESGGADQLARGARGRNFVAQSDLNPGLFVPYITRTMARLNFAGRNA
jgi:hypothetical protein